MIRFLLAAGCLLAASTAAFAEDWVKEYPVSGTPELRLKTGDGSVTVKSWSTPRIEARVITRGWKIGRGAVEIVEHQQGSLVEIEVRVPRADGGLFSNGNRSVRVELRVPAQLKLDLHTGDGSITAGGIGGQLRLSTGDGRIEAEGAEGALDASSGDGSINVSGRFDALSLRTGDGSIKADVRPGSKTTSDWTVKTGDGSVTLRLAKDLAADLDVRTGDGSIHADMPMTIQGMSRKNEIRGKLNGGGRTITVRTGDGSIRVEPSL